MRRGGLLDRWRIIRALVALPFSASFVAGTEVADGPVVYELLPESTFAEGCFELCLCPIALTEGVRGTFVLTPAGKDGGFRLFSVTEIDWTVPSKSSPRTVTGEGTYREGGGVQRLELDLRVGELDVERFDSGLVELEGDSPVIDVSISMHLEPACFDREFGVRAALAGAPLARRYVLGEESGFARGCFKNCDCPVFATDLRGGFLLTSVGEEDAFQVFEVSDIDWEVPMQDGVVLVTGKGTYRLGGVDTLLHRMELDLAVGEEPVEHFDSGLVEPRSRFPRIDIMLSMNFLECFDTVFELHAVLEGSTVPQVFVRGDCNADGNFDVSDAVAVLRRLFSENRALPCNDACDANDDGALDISDGVYPLLSLFASGRPPPLPFPDCGEDPGPLSLGCESFAPCP